MSDRRAHHLFLYDMSLALDKILEFSSGISFEELSHDEIRKDAILRNIQVLGDAAINLPPDFIKSSPGDRLEGDRRAPGWYHTSVFPGRLG